MDSYWTWNDWCLDHRAAWHGSLLCNIASSDQWHGWICGPRFGKSRCSCVFKCLCSWAQRFLSVVLAGALYAYWRGDPFVWPTAGPALALLCAVLSGVAAYTFLMKAMRTGQVSSVTPFRYSRMLFGLVLGILIFGEQLSYSMVLGSSLIVVSGLFIMLSKN